MDDGFPSLSSGSVSSRFVSENEIDLAKSRREEQWKAAYARLGQEPPTRPTEDVYDGRSLAEKLAANRAAKQEEWEERTKLANQFRALEEDEVRFLDSIRAEQAEKDEKRKAEDAEELKAFQKAVAARIAQPDKRPIEDSPPPQPAGNKNKLSQVPIKKKKKNPLQGIVIKTKSTSGKTASAIIDTPKPSDANSDTKRHLKVQESPKSVRGNEESTEAPKKKPRLS